MIELYGNTAEINTILNTSEYIRHHVLEELKKSINPKIHYIDNIYYRYLFLQNENKTAGILVPLILLSKDNKYVSAIYFDPMTGWDWLVKENYRGQHILSTFLKNYFQTIRTTMLKELKELKIELNSKYQGDLSRLVIAIIDNPNKDELEKRIHLGELSGLKILNTPEIEIYKKYYDSDKTLKELRKKGMVDF